MCGIAGVIGARDQALAETCLQRMVTALSRRGPDGEGIELWDGAALGHRRLSIFDLSSAGRQPMLSPDRSIGVVFNGALYNFRELREQLIRAGYQFTSNTDTEVLIHGYAEWGVVEMVKKLRGMFAVGLWDSRSRKCFLFRDRLGVKPLIYVEQGGTLAFASTTRALQAGGLAGEIDPQAVTEFLEFGYVTDQRTIYRNVRKLPAATILEWSGGQSRQFEYWTLADVSEHAPGFEEAVEETERLFLRAVELRLQADVPVGALLSGGVDSSLVCWAIAKLGGNIQAFTVSAPGDPWDEAGDACATAAQLKIDHKVIALSADEAPRIEELSDAYGEPFACASALGMLSVSKAVKPFATVLLTGDGGDDVFLGYPEHRNFWMAQQWANRLPAPLGRLWPAVRGMAPHRGMMRRAVHFMDYATGGLGAVAQAHDGLPVYRQYGILGERLADRTVDQRRIPWSMQSARNLMRDFLRFDRETRFVGEYMTKVDGGAMYHALEARAPFLDHTLWDFAASLPYATRLRGGRLKAILRELARRHLGDRVAYGAKRGFSIPVQRWISGKWAAAVEEALGNSVLEQDSWIRSGPALRMLQDARRNNWAPNQLWYLYVLESWMRREKQQANEALAYARGSERNSV